MINVEKQPAQIHRIFKEIDKNRNMLLIAPGATDYAQNQIVYFDSEDIVKDRYGDSVLTTAFVQAKENGAPHVFLANVQDAFDLIPLAGMLRQYDFAYIVPVGYHLSDYFIDPRKSSPIRTPFIGFLIEAMQNHNRSMVIATDKHANLYEHVDAYLEEMKTISDSLSHRPINKERLVFVLNHLNEWPHANIVLAAALTRMEDEQLYPEPPDSSTVFNLDDLDIGMLPMVYFYRPHNAALTIENLVNFQKPGKAETSVLTVVLANKIHRDLKFDNIIGSQYTANTSHLVRRLLTEYLDSLAGILIESYTIQDIRFIREGAGVGRIEIEMLVKDIRTFEVCLVVLEV